MEKLRILNLFDLDKTLAKNLFFGVEFPWEVLEKIESFIIELGNSLDTSRFDKIGDNVWVAKTAKVAPTAFICGPTIIDEEAEIRHCAFIRGRVIIGKNSVVGNSCELKNSILFDNVEVPHFNYVGDSILGYKSHMGAGSVTSNIKSDRKEVFIKIKGEVISTGLIKVGAFLGDGVEIGCGSVLNPGSVVGKNTNIYPLSSVRGFVEENSIYKCQGEIVRKGVFGKCP